MIAIEVQYGCDVPGCGKLVVVVTDDVIPGSDREQLVRVPSELPAGWSIDTLGNLFCGAHRESIALQ